MGTATEPGGWIAALLQASDSFYPTGSYAHSFGLEGLVQDGRVRDAESMREFLLEQVLPALARTDLAVAALLGSAFEGGVDWERVERLCRLSAAVRGAREPREAALAIGLQRCELVARLRGGIAREFNERAVAGGWPRTSAVAAVVEARSAGAPLEAALASQVYATSASLLSAAVKLLRLGQNRIQAVLSECVEQTPGLIRTALATSEDEVGSFNPWWDIAAARHEGADFRLFIS